MASLLLFMELVCDGEKSGVLITGKHTSPSLTSQQVGNHSEDIVNRLLSCLANGKFLQRCDPVPVVIYSLKIPINTSMLLGMLSIVAPFRNQWLPIL
jgi:hypothetical protein